jgi:hypothetical protein
MDRKSRKEEGPRDDENLEKKERTKDLLLYGTSGLICICLYYISLLSHSMLNCGRPMVTPTNIHICFFDHYYLLKGIIFELFT